MPKFKETKDTAALRNMERLYHEALEAGKAHEALIKQIHGYLDEVDNGTISDSDFVDCLVIATEY